MNLAKYLYTKLMPIYIPRSGTNVRLAIWCCIDVKESSNLLKVLKGIRITVRRGGSPLFVIKRGEF